MHRKRNVLVLSIVSVNFWKGPAGARRDSQKQSRLVAGPGARVAPRPLAESPKP